MKMEARELRIGNFFNLINRDNEVHLPSSVTCVCVGIELDKVFYILVDDKYYDKEFKEYPIHSICGIPLSEEWLLKFGFKKSTEFSYASGEEVEFNVFSKGDLTYNSIQKKWWLRGIMGNHPKYVHDLQNLHFALIGEELKII